MIYLYRPKYDSVNVFPNIHEAESFMNKAGGVYAVFFDAPPTDDQKFDALMEYFL